MRKEIYIPMKLWPLSDIRANIPAFIRDGDESEDSQSDTPACLCAELGSLSLCYLWGEQSQTLVGRPAPVLQYDLLMKHTAINDFPEKIPEHIIHLFKCTRGRLCFLTRLLAVSCLKYINFKHRIKTHSSCLHTYPYLCMHSCIGHFIWKVNSIHCSSRGQVPGLLSLSQA